MHPFILGILLALLTIGSHAIRSIHITSNCAKVITVGVLTNGVDASLPEQSFDLTPGASNSFSKPDKWGGRIWARYFCSGSSGKDTSHCGVPGAVSPASLAEFFFKGNAGKDFYDISLVDGYNIPLSITPDGGSTPNGYECGSPQCNIGACHPDLVIKDSTGAAIACMSSCSASGSSEDCCTDAYNDPVSCKASKSANAVKEICPDAYSFAYDDQKSTFQCEAHSYTVTFC